MIRAVRRRGVAVALAVTMAGAMGGCAAKPRAGRQAAAAEPVRTSTAPAVALAAPSSVPELSRLPSIRTTPLRLSDLRPAPAGPVHISIGRLHVSASVVPVASTLTGQLDVPDSAALVGWYRHSAVPGEAGAVVLAAHVDLHGVRGVFFDLVELRKGDRISLQSAGGARSYRVVAKKQVAKTDVSDAGIFDTSGPARLVLVTCGGSFDRSARSYRDNVVVTAVPA